MQSKEEQCVDELMDSLLKEQVRTDRRQSIREIENAIMKDVVNQAAQSPGLNWRHMLISGSIAAALVLGFGYLLSMILLPDIHRGGVVNKEVEPVSPEDNTMWIQFTIEPNPNSKSNKIVKSVRPTMPAGAETLPPRMVFAEPPQDAGTHGDIVGDPQIGSAPDLLSKPDKPFEKTRFAKLIDQEWCSPYDKPLSTFGIDVEHASYANIRKLVSLGAPVPADMVRIEECINAFRYDYEGPKDKKAFAIHTELITCPWNGSNVLVKVGIKGRDLSQTPGSESDPETIAKDVKVLVEFNPQLVGAYRLIGYASPILSSELEDKSGSGAIEAGHAVTAFYELVPARKPQQLVKVDPLKYQHVGSAPKASANNDEWLTLKLQHKLPQGDTNAVQEKVLKGVPLHWQNAATDTRFATAVVLFGMKLRGMDEVRDITWQQVAQVADPALIGDNHKDRAEFIQLINTLEASER